MNMLEPRTVRRWGLASCGVWLCVVAMVGPAGPLVAAEDPVAAGQAAADNTGAADGDDIISLAAYNVKTDRIEDFGLRVYSRPYPRPARTYGITTVWFAKFAPEIAAVVPNTAAAKAGLQPGERVLKSEGQSTVGGPFSTGKFGQWYKTQKKKWAEVAAGKTNVTWTLEIETAATKAVRIVKLVVPTAPPRWGSSVWHAPEGRIASTVAEAGPLGERSRAVLDNGMWTLIPRPFAIGADGAIAPSAEPNGTAYEWRLGEGREGSHWIVVTQSGGRTRVIFETSSPLIGRRMYLTSPSGVLEKAWRWGRKENVALMKAKTPEAAARVGEMALEDARVGFEHELDLWTTKVGKVSARWPFEVKPGYDANAIFAILAKKDGVPAVARPLAPDFLKLASATEAQRAMFSEAYGKLGADQDRWAYTETSHSIEDKRVTVMRVDPSKPETGRSMLLSIDGKAPTPAEVQQWRDDGGETPKALGDIPPLASIVDLKDLRVAQDEAAAVTFELPMRSDSAEFPADKFQALFRVNKTHRAFEEITVKMRDSFRVAGVVKITEAGLQARFQTLDPALAPQPVLLKGGGAARILLVKVSRDFETTRTDFKRVEAYVEGEGEKR